MYSLTMTVRKYDGDLVEKTELAVHVNFMNEPKIIVQILRAMQAGLRSNLGYDSLEFNRFVDNVDEPNAE